MLSILAIMREVSASVKRRLNDDDTYIIMRHTGTSSDHLSGLFGWSNWALLR